MGVNIKIESRSKPLNNVDCSGAALRNTLELRAEQDVRAWPTEVEGGGSLILAVGGEQSSHLEICNNAPCRWYPGSFFHFRLDPNALLMAAVVR